MEGGGGGGWLGPTIFRQDNILVGLLAGYVILIFFFIFKIFIHKLVL